MGDTLYIPVEILNQMEVKPPTTPSEAGYESSMVSSMARGMLDTTRLVPGSSGEVICGVNVEI